MQDYFLADDLSGALDAAAAFHHAGRAVRIVLEPKAWAVAGPDEVIAVTTETRNASARAAAAVVSEVLAAARRRGARLVYKKIDSTLRGQVAAELAAVAAALPGVRVLFTPANPAVGRTVRDGVLLVHGVPVAETEFAHDPMSPVRESDIRRLLGRAMSPRVTIADAAREEDLAAAVARVDAAGGEWVGVGSGALARPVALRRSKRPFSATGVGDEERRGAGPASAQPTAGGKKFLIVCGSAHRANAEQSAALARERGVPLLRIRPGDIAGAATAAVSSLQRHGGAALMAPVERGESGAVVGALAEAAAAAIERTAVRRLFVTGGETAFAVARRLGVTALRFVAEIEPGLSLSAADLAKGPLWLAVKPGGFGGAQTWLRAVAALTAAP